MKALLFGAGKIGRGFIGAVLRKSGYDICFADVNPQLIDLINTEKQYLVHILDINRYDELIDGISAVHTDSEELLDIFTSADIATTAVSMKVLPAIAPTIANGIKHRKTRQNTAPMNIVACENGIRATSLLKTMVYGLLSEEEKTWADRYIGFADSSVDRIVPITTYSHQLEVAVEAFYEWNVDKKQLKETLPDIPGLHLTDDLTAHIERKLFTVNTGHCATAFLGNISGYTYIHECLDDAKLKATVTDIMRQSGDALIAKFHFDRQAHENYINIVLGRFANPYIKDLTSRVGHDPKRKLGPKLYFSYPISMALSSHLPTDKLSLAIAAGMSEDISGDPQCEEIRQLILQKGLSQAITEITGQTSPVVIQQITEAYNLFHQ